MKFSSRYQSPGGVTCQGQPEVIEEISFHPVIKVRAVSPTDSSSLAEVVDRFSSRYQSPGGVTSI